MFYDAILTRRMTSEQTALHKETKACAVRLFAPIVGYLFLATLSGFLLFWHLGGKPLENWDEGIHAEVSREMLHDGAWMSLSYRGALYTAKPPLKFWLTTPLMPFFGEREFVIRFWSALAGLITTVLLSWWAWQATRRHLHAIALGALFVLGRFVLYHAFRTGETDGLLVLWVVASMYAYWRSWTVPHWISWFSVFVALGIMTKSFAGFIPLLIAIVDTTLAKRWKVYGKKNLFMSLGIGLALILPWHLIELSRHGWLFWNGYFGFNVLDRTNRVLYANNVSWHWYLDVMHKRMFPFWPLAVASFFFGIWRWLKEHDPVARLMVLWTVIVLLLFTLVKTKFDWYILPLYPPLVWLMATATIRAFRTQVGSWFGALVLLVFAWSVWDIPFGLVHAGLLWWLTPYVLVPAVSTQQFFQQCFVVLSSIIFVALIFFLFRRLAKQYAVHIVLAFMTIYFSVLALGWDISYLRHEAQASPLLQIAQSAERAQLRTLQVIGFSLVNEPAGYFYLRRANITLRELKYNNTESNDPVLVVNTALTPTLRIGRNLLQQQGKYTLLSAKTP